MAEENKSFWSNLPALLTSIAGLITAIVGIYIYLDSRPPENLSNDEVQKTEASLKNQANVTTSETTSNPKEQQVSTTSEQINEEELIEKPEVISLPKKDKIELAYTTILSGQVVKVGNYLPIDDGKYSLFPNNVSENPEVADIEIKNSSQASIATSKLYPGDYYIFEDTQYSYKVRLLRVKIRNFGANYAYFNVERASKIQ
ncbi:hypothetical protein [Cyclobacterium qasimii]|uniref:Uncharacterized protein n=2 Tax=Cyclobacterium qasimii TaxID=1350429 RepID=S7V7T7_9BACT|nr:hypothetical protein [Cyclobacterium qasimii]EPR65642.1 hypothetical protein ADICYQ_5349 [Cyclobacterium qasimii M12-11B]GEO20163.1 hypothetical protein CQA01_06970 [Cyclobacterium qasimii]